MRQNCDKDVEMQASLADPWLREMVCYASFSSVFYWDLQVNLIEKNRDELCGVLLTIQECLELIGVLKDSV